MKQYLYGLMPAESAPAVAALSDLRGLQGMTVELTCFADVAVVHSVHDGSEILRTRRQMQAHTRVLEALVTCGPVLPMRFGLASESLEDIGPWIDAAREQMGAEFARIGRQVEIGLRIAWPREAALARLLEAEPGLARARDRLLGRGHEAHFERIELGRRVAEALERRRTDAQRHLVRRLAAACADHVVSVPESDVEALRMECLVPVGTEGSLAAAAERAAIEVDFAGAAEPEVRIVGPLPPYSFVDPSLFWNRMEAI